MSKHGSISWFSIKHVIFLHVMFTNREISTPFNMQRHLTAMHLLCCYAIHGFESPDSLLEVKKLVRRYVIFFGSLVWRFLHITFLASRILRGGALFFYKGNLFPSDITYILQLTYKILFSLCQCYHLLNIQFPYSSKSQHNLF